jgi:hypothetical protein
LSDLVGCILIRYGSYPGLQGDVTVLFILIQIALLRGIFPHIPFSLIACSSHHILKHVNFAKLSRQDQMCIRSKYSFYDLVSVV